VQDFPLSLMALSEKVADLFDLAADSSVLEEVNAHNFLSVNQGRNLPILQLFGETHHVLEEHFLLHFDVVSSELPVLCMIVHPGSVHAVENCFSQETFGFGHHFGSEFTQQFEVLFYFFVLSGFSTQNDGEFLIDIVEQHSELLAIALLTAELHQDFLYQPFVALCDFLQKSNFRSENLIKPKLIFEALDCAYQKTRHIVE